MLICPSCESVSQVASRGVRFMMGGLVLVLVLLAAAALGVAAFCIFKTSDSPKLVTHFRAAGGVMALVGGTFIWLANDVFKQVCRLDLIPMHRKLPPRR